MSEIRGLRAFTIFYFLLGLSIIIGFFLIQTISIQEINSNPADYNGAQIEVAGKLSKTFNAPINDLEFEEEIIPYILEKKGHEITVVTPEIIEGDVSVTGRLIYLPEIQDNPHFIYATKVSETGFFENMGISSIGIIMVLLYVFSVGVALLYERNRKEKGFV